MTTRRPRQRGAGSVFRATWTDEQGVLHHASTWAYRHACRCCPGHRHQETGFATKGEARAALNLRLAQIARGKTRFLADHETLEMLLGLVLTDYEVNGRKALGHARRRAFFLIDYFGAGEKAVSLSPDRMMEYIKQRQRSGASNSTINHELGLLRRGFVLALRAGRLDARPYIPRLKPAPPRQGMFQREELDLVLRHLDADLRPLFETAYITGWRCKSELTTRQWRHIEFGPETWTCGCQTTRTEPSCETCQRFRPGWLRIEPGEAKNGQGRQFPLIPSLRILLEEQRRRTDELERATGQIIPWVFWRSSGSGVQVAGAPIRSYHRAWAEARAKAGLQGKIPHDLRRTRVVELDRLGIARTVAKQITGHKTDRIYEQYGVPEVENMVRAGIALETFFGEQTEQPKRLITGVFTAQRDRAKR